MASLNQRILDRIRDDGPLTFEQFMGMALYEPCLGYYTSERTDIGIHGDFYTSPHLHPLFGALIGRQLQEMWEALGRPGVFRVIEIGGGRGYLSKDILDYLSGKEIYDSLTYSLVEINPRLRARQEELLSGHRKKLDWPQSLSAAGKVRGCIVSNEVLDALPVHVVQMDDRLREVYVASEGETLDEELLPPSTQELEDYLREFSIKLPPGYRTEVNLALKAWLREVSEALEEGFVLTIDYGYPAREYYAQERNRGTLLCYHRHRLNENPYENIGQQDITAHVNFSALKNWGERMGLSCLGFTRQGPYLVSLGIDEVMAELYENSEDLASEAARVKGLIMPGAMGDTHKVMVQYRGEGSPVLRGFALKNQKDKL